MDAAETSQLVGEEGLERGFVGTLAAGGFNFIIMFASKGTILAIMLTVVRTGAVIPLTDVRGDLRFGALINIFPKSAITPTASDSVSIAALLVKEVELKLERICVIGKSTENTGAG
ncbi:beta-1,4-mannosyltransferase egh [Babesia caballi]|uniref:Beta-1,4-mannosyltransferase egh n=1 Tax=Babesia caballi TaxID=5871 RepID=A0AAV4LTP6_BABCB|nr:beta-1,4-mannosyltransferase egh [Babesia caballi]